MNKLIISIFLLAFALTLSAQIRPVVISEVFYDTPLEEDAQSDTRHNGEFIELYNPTMEDIDISGWYINDDKTRFTFPLNTTIASKKAILVAYRFPGTNFELKTLFPNIPNNTQIFYHSNIMLSNTGERISLYNKDHNLIDQMSYRYGNISNPYKLRRVQTYWNIEARNGKKTSNLLSIQRKSIHCSSSIQLSVNDYFVDTPTPGIAYPDLLTQTVESVLYPPGTVNTNLPVGTLPGTASVTPTGAATYTIPIEVPPGTNGCQPQISIVYNSQGGYGALGMGWDIGGLSSISRGMQNFYFDEPFGGTIDATTIKFDDTDRLYIDGQRLILLDGTDGTHFQENAVYGYETENYARVKILKSSNTQKIYFELTTKEGAVTEYGKTADALLKSGDKIMAWRINKIKDVYDNEINYTYRDDGQYLLHIDYGNNEINFSYKTDRIMPRKRNINGFWMNQDWLLSYVSVNTFNSISVYDRPEYFFNYIIEKQDVRLESIEHGVFKASTKEFHAFNKTKIEWGKESKIEEVTLGKMQDGSLNTKDNTILYTGDIDGDGVPDLIELCKGSILKPKEQGNINVVLRGKNKNIRKVYFNAISDTWYLYPDYNQLVIGDINNDGKDEIIRIALDGIYVYSYNETNNTLEEKKLNYSATGRDNPIYYNSLDKAYTYIPFLLNANNDEYIDLVLIPYIKRHNNAVELPAYHSYKAQIFYGTSQGLSDAVISEQTISVSDLDGNFVAPIIGDFNADGKLDLMQLTYNKSSISHLANIDIIETGKWQQGIIGYRNGYDEFFGIITHRFNNAYPIDINNDGFTDILFKLDDSHNNKWWLKRNKGGYDDYVTDFKYYTNIKHNYSRKTSNKDERDFSVVIDYNGDGYQDLIIADDIYDGKNFKRSEWHFYKNIGGDLQFERTIIKNAPVSKMNPVVMDINNDGVPDLVFGSAENKYGKDEYRAFAMPNANKRNVVHSITNGMGQTESFTYKYFSNYNHTENRTDLRDLKAPVMVVDKHTVIDGSSTSYSYEKPKIHTKGKGFLGFEKVTTTNNRTKQKIVSEYEINTDYYIVNPKKQTVSVNGIEISETLQTNAVIHTAIQKGKNNEKRFIPVVSKQTITDKIRNSTTTTDNTFNQYGVLTKTVTTSADATSITEYSDFHKLNSAGLVAYLPKTEKVTTKRTGQPDYIFTSTCTYNDKGGAETVTKMKDTYAQSITTYTYYPSGNLQQVSVTTADNTTPKVTKYFYDDDFRFVTETENVLEQKAYFTHDNWGRTLTETDIDGLITEYQYDVFGRLKKKKLPTGEKISYKTEWGTTCRYKKTVTSSEFGEIGITHYDAFGRETYSETQGWKGTKLKSFTEYDPVILKVKRHIKPRYDGEVEIYSDYEYNDYLQRITKEKLFDGENTLITKYSYNDAAGTVTVTLPNGQTQTSFTNTLGEVTKRSDAGGSILYTYNALGKPVKIETNGSLTEIEYDEIGRQKKLHDPNAGTIEYEYYADGQLKKQTNANDDITEFTYDHAGRTDTKTVKDYEEGLLLSETETKYNYIENGNGIGQIESIILKENGNIVHSQIFEYNNKHLLESVTDVYDGKSFTFSYSYDNLWRPLSTTSPSGLVTTNEYNSYGDLVKIKKGETVIWEGTAQNSRGQFTEYNLGNGIVTTNIFKPRGELTDIQAKKGTNFIQNNHYEYESLTGNLLVRKDLKNNRNERFEYDNLDRLTKAYLNNVLQYEISYQLNGNIAEKSDVGIYNYDANYKPHAMLGITGEAGEGISNDKQFIEYTPFNKISRVAQGIDLYNITAEYKIYYGLDQQRIKTEFFDNGNLKLTRYYLGSYELDIDEYNNEIETDYISSPSGLIAMQKNNNLYYVHCDRQGSLERITDTNGDIVTAYYYTAWGVRQKLAGTDITDRGYTGHEHLTALGLINMNGRVYDPVLARFLSPDPFVQAPDFTQSFNRYSYCLNNPFKYTDPEGEFWHLIIGAIIGGVVNLSINLIAGNVDNFWQGLGYFGIGAVAGALGAGVGAGISSMLPVAGTASGGFGAGFLGTSTATTATSSFASGAFIGGGSGLVSGFTTGFGNDLMKGGSFGHALGEGGLSGVAGGFSGALIGGFWQGIDAALDGRRFGNGARLIDEQVLADKNLPLVKQKGKMNCGPAIGESTTGVSQEEYRAIIGGDPDTDPVSIRQINNAIGKKTQRPTQTIATDMPKTLEGATRIADQMNSYSDFYVSSRDAEQTVGHVTSLNSIKVKTYQRISGSEYHKITYQVMDPYYGAYRTLDIRTVRALVIIFPVLF